MKKGRAKSPITLYPFHENISKILIFASIYCMYLGYRSKNRNQKILSIIIGVLFIVSVLLRARGEN